MTEVRTNRLREVADFMKRQTNVDPTWLREAADEIDRLRAIEAVARVYYFNYCQDEAAELECCFDPKQHAEAQALRDALYPS